MNENKELYGQGLSYKRADPPMQNVTAPWFVRSSKACYQPHHRCRLEPLNCGQAVFEKIHNDVMNAERSVDIITWGFDPGMVLIRSPLGSGLRYGELLKQVATRANPVIVRLLLWHDDLMSHHQMRNNPGLYGGGLITAKSSAGFYSEEHAKYNALWFDDVTSGKIPNIRLHLRKIPLKFRDDALADEKCHVGLAGEIASVYPSHHQKMILVDFEHPRKALGYVMGHNSTTDFWDTAEHNFKCPLRETLYRADPTGLLEGWRKVQDDALDYINHYSYPVAPRPRAAAERSKKFYREHAFTAKPYQDVSLRVRGPILYDLNHNFCQAWSESTPASTTGFAILLKLAKPTSYDILTSPAHKYIAELQSATYPEVDPEFRRRRSMYKPKNFELADGEHSAQLLRTQPMHGEKSIKECYANFIRNAKHYIFIQNQYVQYVEWATALRSWAETLRKAGYPHQLYLFILTSTPESTGMDWPTYDVAAALGQGETMKFEHDKAQKKEELWSYSSPITSAALEKLGIRVVMCSLWSCAESPNQAADFEEIYIHAKVAIVDDTAFTLGSANLNVRSMALDSELNILSDAQDLTYGLRTVLFKQCSGSAGPEKFGPMADTLQDWASLSKKNFVLKKILKRLKGQVITFYVDRKPGSPVM